MRRYTKYIAIILVILIVVSVIIVINKNKLDNQKENGKLKIITSFYPMYIMTANITEGAKNIELVNMADTNIGCIHDYTLTTNDMKKLEKADIYIQNGLGLEDFVDKMMTSNKELYTINASQGIENLIEYDESTNSHIWTSIPNYIEQIKNITRELLEKNPENKNIYETNSKEYIQKLSDLKSRYDMELNLSGTSALILNESFEYLGRDLGLNLNAVRTSHEERGLSAETIKNIIDWMKQNNAKIIIVDIEDNLKNAEIIAHETGAKIYKLNSAVNGTLSKEAYISAMTSNLESLKQ